MRWQSPRGMVSIDPETRDVVQTVYIRRVEWVGGELRTSIRLTWLDATVRPNNYHAPLAVPPERADSQGREAAQLATGYPSSGPLTPATQSVSNS